MYRFWDGKSQMPRRSPWRSGSITSFFVLVMAFFLITGFAYSAHAANTSKTFDRAEILATAKANEDGMARILVRFEVPGLAKLAKASEAHKVITPAQAQLSGVNKAGVSADKALAQGIAKAGTSVLSGLASSSFKVIYQYDYIPFLALSVTPATLKALEADPKVTGIYFDRPVPLADPVDTNGVQVEKSGWRDDSGAKPSPPQLTTSTRLIGATTAWSRGYQGQGWYVAVLDTGIRRTHEMFSGKTIIEACFSRLGHCPNGRTVQYGTYSARHHSSAYRGWDHGSHVAGIAAGYASTRRRYGVARRSNLIAVQVFSRFTGYSNCGSSYRCVLSYNSDQVAGLNYVYALRNGRSIASVNMSLGGGRYSSSSACNSANAATKAAIDRLRGVRIATVIASGNNGYCTGISAPACISSAVSVGASSGATRGASFSNFYRTLLNVFAPGVSITSATGSSNTSYGSWNGTSMATPHVAGAWALMRQKYRYYSVTSILSRLQSYGIYIQSHCSGSTNRRPFIRVDRALGLGGSTVPRPRTIYPAGTISDRTPRYRWSAVSGATYYQIQLYRGSTRIYSYTVRGRTYVTPSRVLSYNVYYRWRVRAYRSGRWSSFSALRTFRIATAVPRPRTIYPAGTISDRTPRYRWSAVTGATYYQMQLYRGTTRIYSYTVRGRTYVTPSRALSYNVYYRWRVRAYRSGRWSSFSAFRTFRVAVAVPAPRTLYPYGNIRDRTPTYRWSAVTGATYYQIQCYYGSTRIYSYTVRGRTTVTPTRVLNYTYYRWRVRAYRSGRWSAFSALRTFRVVRTATVTGFYSPFTSNAAGWYSYGGTWRYGSGYLYTDGYTSNKWAWALYYRTWRGNWTYYAYMRRINQGTNANCVITHVTPNPRGSTYNTPYTAFMFNYANTGRYYIGYYYRGTFRTLKSWTSSSYIRRYGWNQLRVRVVSTRYLYLYINGRYIGRVTNWPITYGRVGVCMYAQTVSSRYRYYVDYARLYSGVSTSSMPTAQEKAAGFTIDMNKVQAMKLKAEKPPTHDPGN